MPQLILGIILIYFIFQGLKILAIPILIWVLCWAIYKGFILAFEYFYFNSESFLEIKNNLAKNAENFNELNKNI